VPFERLRLVPIVAEDEVVIFARLVAIETRLAMLLRERPIGFAVAGEAFESPTSCGGKPAGILEHHVDSLPNALAGYAVFFLCIVQVKNQDRTFRKFTAAVALHGFVIRVDVVDTSRRLEKRTARAHQRRSYMSP